MKYADALESRNDWVYTIMDLPPLIMMGNEKQGGGFKHKVGLF